MYSFAHLYHEKTKYDPLNIHLFVDDTLPCKPEKLSQKNNKLEELLEIDLSEYLPLSKNPFSEKPIKPEEHITEDEIPLMELSRLLYFTYGVTGIIPNPEKSTYIRTVPSAGALYPNEIYFYVQDFHPRLNSKIFKYNSQKHSIQETSQEQETKELIFHACLDNKLIKESQLVFFITSVFARSSWRYKDRAYRRILLDSGHIISNLALLATEYLKRKIDFIGSFQDNQINKLLSLNPVEEEVLCLITVSKNSAEEEQQESFNYQVDLIKEQYMLEYYEESYAYYSCQGSLLSAVHYSCKIHSPEELNSFNSNMLDRLWGERNEANKFLLDERMDCNSMTWNSISEMLDVILDRRSTRKFDIEESISKSELSQILEYAYRNLSINNSTEFNSIQLILPLLLKNYLIIHNVDGLEEGCYSYCPLEQTIKQIRFKNLRKETLQMTMQQKIAEEASAIILLSTDLNYAVNCFGSRAYRYLHLLAGQIGQRIQLASTKLGLGSSGIAGFFDDMTNDILCLPEDNAILYMMGIGIKS